MMHEVGIGDVLFILLILGLIHGIMRWVSSLKKNKSSAEEEPSHKPTQSP